MKKTFFAGLLSACLFGLASNAIAGNDRPNPSQEVVVDTGTIVLVLVSSHTMTEVDTPTLEGSFVAEIQNPSTTDAICCSFEVSASTVTASAQGQSCRWIPKNYGTWTVSRWWRDITLYCQTASTTGTGPVVVTQGK